MTSRSYDIATAIFYFFKRFGQKPGAAIWLIVCQIVVLSALVAGAGALLAPAVIDLIVSIEAHETGALSETEMASLMLETLLPIMGLGSLVSIVGILAALMFQGAWLRFLTRGEVKPGIPYRLGGDELRLFGVNLIYIGLGMAAYIAVAIVAVIMTVLGALLIGNADGGSVNVAGSIVFGLIVALTLVGGVAALVIVSLRLASAPAMTVLHGGFRFSESWGASKGVTGNLLATYLAVFVIAAVANSILSTIVQLIALGVMAPVMGDMQQALESGTVTGIEDVFAYLQPLFSQPAILISFGALGIVMVIFQIAAEGMVHGVGAYNAVRDAGGEGADLDASRLEAGHPMGASPSRG